jgi:hypothetical protein
MTNTSTGTLHIDKDVNLPEKIDAFLRRGPRRKYPFPAMAVGDSFQLPDPIKFPEDFSKVRSSVNVYNSKQRKNAKEGFSPRVFIVGQDDKGIWRCWRQS